MYIRDNDALMARHHSPCDRKVELSNYIHTYRLLTATCLYDYILRLFKNTLLAHNSSNNATGPQSSKANNLLRVQDHPNYLAGYHIHPQHRSCLRHTSCSRPNSNQPNGSQRPRCSLPWS